MTDGIEVCVGRIGKAHGVRGEVSVEVRTDQPEQRFVLGACLTLRSNRPGLPASVTIEGIRRHQDRLLLRLREVADREAAEAVRGALLCVGLPAEDSPENPEEFYDHQLVGLSVEDTDGTAIGTVRDVLHNSAQDLLVIAVRTDTADDREVLVPFVAPLVPVVDVAAGRLVVADRPGLLTDPTEPDR